MGRYRVIKKDNVGNKIVKLPDGNMAVYNKNGSMVNKEGSRKIMQKFGYKINSKGKKLFVAQSPAGRKMFKTVPRLHKPRKGIIDMNSLDMLARF